MRRASLSVAVGLLLSQSLLLLACGGGGNDGGNGGGSSGTTSAATPSVTNASTNEDTQTRSGLVIGRNVANGAEVSHFKITDIVGGTLHHNDGTTLIASGAFITFAQGNAGLRFTPNANSTSNGSFTVQASTAANDGGLGGGTVTATITVNAVNDAPTVASAIPDQTARAGTAFSYQFAANAFADVDAGDSLTYTATLSNGSALPSWLTFSAGTRTFSGTPLAGDVGAIIVRLTARDNALATASDDFTLTVNAAGASLNGWDLTTSNTGLARLGISCDSLPTYTGPSKPAAGTTITLQKITYPELILSNGNITLDRVCVKPTSVSNRMGVVFGYDPDTGENQLGNVTIVDSDIDGSLVTNASVYTACGFRGAGSVYRTKIWGLGNGICYFGSPTVSSAVVEGNYVFGLRGGMYGSPPQQSHNESGTIRSFMGTSLVWRNNRLISQTGSDSGALFIQTISGSIQNVLIEGNYLETAAWNLALEAAYGNTYTAMQARNNRFVIPPGGFGAAYVTGGPGWAVWSENYRYDATATDGKGLPIGRP